jgi:hypothetical protein
MPPHTALTRVLRDVHPGSVRRGGASPTPPFGEHQGHTGTVRDLLGKSCGCDGGTLRSARTPYGRSSCFLGLKWVPSKWRPLVPPRRIEPVEITSPAARDLRRVPTPAGGCAGVLRNPAREERPPTRCARGRSAVGDDDASRWVLGDAIKVNHHNRSNLCNLTIP